MLIYCTKMLNYLLLSIIDDHQVATLILAWLLGKRPLLRLLLKIVALSFVQQPASWTHLTGWACKVNVDNLRQPHIEVGVLICVLCSLIQESLPEWSLFITLCKMVNNSPPTQTSGFLQPWVHLGQDWKLPLKKWHIPQAEEIAILTVHFIQHVH